MNECERETMSNKKLKQTTNKFHFLLCFFLVLMLDILDFFHMIK